VLYHEAGRSDKLVWNNLCTQNLAKFVHDLITAHKNLQKRVKPEDRKKKVIGVVARGCTTRSLIIHCRRGSTEEMKSLLSAFPAMVMWTEKA
jgi:hypothetical protein